MRTTTTTSIGRLALALIAILSIPAFISCSPKTESGSVTPRTMTDALFAVLAADRTIYTRHVVNRLQNEEKIINATEYWQDEKTLPLPAQMFRMGSELVRDNGAHFSYALLSIWPVNRQNGPKTEAEKEGLQYVVDRPDENFYTEEVLGGKRYFTAVYADKAVSEACSSCHNAHKDSPKRDFKLNDVMGGVVIRIPLD
jgi:hypothetical protein